MDARRRASRQGGGLTFVARAPGATPRAPLPPSSSRPARHRSRASASLRTCCVRSPSSARCTPRQQFNDGVTPDEPDGTRTTPSTPAASVAVSQPHARACPSSACAAHRMPLFCSFLRAPNRTPPREPRELRTARERAHFPEIAGRWPRPPTSSHVARASSTSPPVRSRFFAIKFRRLRSARSRLVRA